VFSSEPVPPSDRESRKGLHIADRRTKSGYGTSPISKPLHKIMKPSVVSEVGRKLRDSWSIELSVLEISENFWKLAEIQTGFQQLSAMSRNSGKIP
jgi:hypothetical protein